MTDTASNGTEIYVNKLFEIADEYINQYLDDDIQNFKKSKSMQLIYFIHDRLPTVDNNDIEGLNALFDAYVRLCSRFELLPTLNQFAILAGNQAATYSEWLHGEYRTKQPRYAQSVKRWKSICESFLADSLTNSDQTSVNKIFVAKSNYGWTETAPIPTINQNQHENLGLDDVRNAFEQFQIEQNTSTIPSSIQ